MVRGKIRLSIPLESKKYVELIEQFHCESAGSEKLDSNRAYGLLLRGSLDENFGRRLSSATGF